MRKLPSFSVGQRIFCGFELNYAYMPRDTTKKALIKITTNTSSLAEQVTKAIKTSGRLELRSTIFTSVFVLIILISIYFITYIPEHPSPFQLMAICGPAADELHWRGC